MKSEKGIFLLEVLYAALFIAILGAAVVYGLEQSLRVFNKSNNITRATYLAEEKLFDKVMNIENVPSEGEFDMPEFLEYKWEFKEEPDPDNPEFNNFTIIIKNKFNEESYVILSAFKEK